MGAHRMAKKDASPHQHPLDKFLAQNELDNAPRLEILARKYAAEPFDVDSFRKELTAKVQRLRYPQPYISPNDKTFSDVLKDAGVLSILLREDTLRELWKSVLLKKICQRERQLKGKRETADGIPLRDQRRKARRINKDQETLKRMEAEYDLENVAPLYEKIAGKSVEATLPLYESRGSDSKEELLTGRPRMPKWRKQSRREASQWFPFNLRNEDTAIQVVIYRTLRPLLPNEEAGKKHISDKFLR